MEASDQEAREAEGRSTWPIVVGCIGCVSVGVGYLLEALRQRGDCDAGDKSPDTLVISIVLIVVVGGLFGVIGIVGTLIYATRRRWTVATTIQAALPAMISLAGFLAIFLVGGRGPSTWFQYCAT